jgi:ketosteroid isomerase-like protein
MATISAPRVDSPQLQAFLDEQAVRNVHLRYCRAIDRQDWELVASCYHEGAVDNHGMYDGGFEGFIEFAKGFVDAAEVTLHIVGNQLVDLDGDVAWHEATCLYYERAKATDSYPRYDRTVYFRYCDRMERREERWGIVDRAVIVDGEQQAPVHDSLLPIPSWHYGSTDATDPTYNRERPQAEYLAERRGQ